MKNFRKGVLVAFISFLMLSAIGCAPGVSIEEYNKVLAEQSESSASIEQFKSELSDANKMIADLAIQINQITGEKDSLQAEFDDYVKKSTEYNALIGVEKQAAIDVASRKLELESIKAESDELENSMLTLVDEINALTAQKETLEAEIFALENKIIEYKEMPVQLTNGNYTAGIDFPAGKYDIYAVAGRGTVSTEDSINYGSSIYEMMGVSGSYYIKEYQNVLLQSGTIIRVSGVTIELREKAN